MTDRAEFVPRSDKPKVVITDYDFGDVDVETEILEAAGAEVIALQAKCEEDLFAVAPDCAGSMRSLGCDESPVRIFHVEIARKCHAQHF